ncbi:MAG: LPS export ABC transporter permease LptF [Acidobacteria bacterium]|nr:LPS export ABC transporter permease LptF [Acidobacteriota bacterium]
MTPLARLRPTLLDRYIVREILPPTGLGLLLFTFILLLQQITVLMGVLISRGADLPTVVRVFVYLLPSILAVTIPMAFLLGILLAFGRLASDCEIVALRASGVSPLRLLRPLLALSVATCLATFWVMAVALPAANQAHRRVLFNVAANKAKTSLKPRVFNDDLVGGMVVYISDIPAETGLWKDVFIHDARIPQKPRVILARSGRLVIDEHRKAVELHLENGAIHALDPAQPELYEQQRFASGDFPLPFEQFFPQIDLPKGDREMTLGELSARVAELRSQGKAPRETAGFRVEWHKKFAIPAACLVFGLLGLGLSLGSKKEARSAAFGLSIAVIFIYYVIIRLGEQAGDTGMLSPFLGMWGANILLGALALVLLALNQHEAAFDPLDPSHYTSWLPRIRRAEEKPALAKGPGRPPLATVRRRPVVVVKVPRLTVRFPGILDRYVARAYVGHFFLVLVAFWSFFLLGEFLDLFDDIQQHKVKGKVVVHYYLFHAPFILHLIAPFAVLVATLTTFGILARRNEVTAMKAGGVSVYRATLPAVLLGALCSLVLMGMGEFLLPFTNRVASQDFNVIKGRPPQTASALDHRWIIGSDERLYNYEYLVEGQANPGHEGFSLYGLSVYDVDPKGWDLRDRLFAARAAWNGIAYDLERGWRRSFGERSGFRNFQAARTREVEPPAYFRREEKGSDGLGFRELRTHIAALEAKGFDVTKLRVQLHRKLAFPTIGVVMTLIGIPFAFVVGRHGALYGVGISIVIAIVLWACLAIFEALGNNALLPAVLAVWAPNLLFSAAGLYLMLTLET